MSTSQRADERSGALSLGKAPSTLPGPGGACSQGRGWGGCSREARSPSSLAMPAPGFWEPAGEGVPSRRTRGKASHIYKDRVTVRPRFSREVLSPGKLLSPEQGGLGGPPSKGYPRTAHVCENHRGCLVFPGLSAGSVGRPPCEHQEVNVGPPLAPGGLRLCQCIWNAAPEARPSPAPPRGTALLGKYA